MEIRKRDVFEELKKSKKNEVEIKGEAFYNPARSRYKKR